MKKLKLRNFPIVLSVIILLSIYYATFGTFDIFLPGKLGSSFDSLAKNLLSFDASVDPAAISWEAIIINGKRYMYFGAFLAFLRMPLNIIFSDMYGKWSCISTIVAYSISTFAIGKILILALNLNDSINDNLKKALFRVSMFAFMFASPIFL